MFEPQPRLLSKRMLHDILKQMPEFQGMHRWEPNQVLKHFAYLLPEGGRFTEADASAFARQMDLGRVFIDKVLGELTDEGHALARGSEIRETMRSLLGIGPARWVQKYYMPKNVRAQYQIELRRLEEDSEPERRAVSETLEELATTVTRPEQKTFLDETLICLKVGANRAAIVMAWNLAYDHVRRWVFDKHLSTFNRELTSRYRTKTKTYDPVASVDDFPDSEWLVLDVCRKAGIINKEKMQTLEQALRKRNQFAHPSSARASPAMAAGFIAELLDNVLLDAYFD